MRSRLSAGACSEVLAVTALVATALVAAQPAPAAVSSCRPRPAQPQNPGSFGNVFIGVAVTSACNA